MAASRAMLTAGDTSLGSNAQSRSSATGMGNPLGTDPKRVPMVSTSSASPRARAVVATRATRGAGRRALTRGQNWMMRTVASASPVVTGSSASRCCKEARHCSRKWAGAASPGRPRASPICPAAMISAIPLVKPTVTG